MISKSPRFKAVYLSLSVLTLIFLSVNFVSNNTEISTELLFSEENKLIPENGKVGYFYGSSLSISGEYVIVGDTGRAYIFKKDPEKNTWSFQQMLEEPKGNRREQFGAVVAISDGYAIVGEHSDNDIYDIGGAAHIFKMDEKTKTWSHMQKLTPSDLADHDNFGNSVAIHGDYAIVGSIADDDMGFESGSAYIFKRDEGKETWSETSKLTASDGEVHDFFGESVAIYGDYAIVGAFCDDHIGIDSGSAYIFKKDPGKETWMQNQKLTVINSSDNNYFGCSVDIYENYAVVGAYCHDELGYGTGLANIYKLDEIKGTWDLKRTLMASDAKYGHYFGCSVSIYGDYTIVGAYGDYRELDYRFAYDWGAAYIFSKNQDGPDMWGQIKKLTASDGQNYDRFGASVAISENKAVVGTLITPVLSPNRKGSAYVFEHPKGKLQVLIKSKKAVRAGAMWHLEGMEKWLESRSTITINAGEETIVFKKIKTWRNPKKQKIIIEANKTTKVVVKYKPR